MPFFVWYCADKYRSFRPEHRFTGKELDLKTGFITSVIILLVISHLSLGINLTDEGVHFSWVGLRANGEDNRRIDDLRGPPSYSRISAAGSRPR